MPLAIGRDKQEQYQLVLGSELPCPLQVQREHWSHYLRSPFPGVKTSWEGVMGGDPADRISRHGAQLVAFATGTLAVILSAMRLRKEARM